MMHPLLRTPRLILRPWQDEDLEAFASLNADPKVMEFFPAMLSREESDNLAGRIQKEFLEKQYGLWAVEAPGMSRFIGFIGLHFQNFKAHFTPCVEIGWRLASPFWGKGYATEGARAALQYGFEKVHLSQIVSFTAKINTRSQKVMERIGMQTDSSEDFEHPSLPEGHPLRLHVLYRLSREEWLRQAKFKN
jgi:RimJ/RimL family protein N-acetyltransferase